MDLLHLKVDLVLPAATQCKLHPIYLTRVSLYIIMTYTSYLLL